MTRLQSLIQEQHAILDLVVAGGAQDQGLNRLAVAVSHLLPHARALIILADRGGIPARGYSGDLDFSLVRAIQEKQGGIANFVFTRHPRSSRDLASSNQWPAAWRDLCLSNGIQACHITPIEDPEGEIAGSLMLCFDRQHEPEDWERQVALFSAGIAAMIISRERMELALRLRDEQVRNLEELAVVGRLSASIAHEINNPLTSVTNLLYLLSQDGSLSPKAQSYVETAQSELQRAAQISAQTLKFYRRRASLERCSVADLVRGLLTLYRPRLEQAKVSVRFEDTPAQPILCNAGELRQVFANLLTNALDALAQRNGFIRVRIRPGRVWKRALPGVRITIADNGQGMDPAIRARIYDALFTTKEAAGTGLGLWVSAGIVNKHGGTIFVRSQPGKGTAFSIALPTDRAQA